MIYEVYIYFIYYDNHAVSIGYPCYALFSASVVHCIILNSIVLHSIMSGDINMYRTEPVQKQFIQLVGSMNDKKGSNV